jgi:hypothetical protein
MELKIFLLFTHIMFINANTKSNCCAIHTHQKLCNINLFPNDENSHELFAIT